MSIQTETKTHGTAVLTCQDHPKLRWRQTKYSLLGAARQFIGRGQLLFDGEEGGKPSAYLLNQTEAQVRAKGPEYESWYREHWTPECDCLEAALVFVRWAEE